MEEQSNNNRKLFFILIILGILLILCTIGILFEGQKISNELKHINEITSETGDPFAGIEDMGMDSILYSRTPNTPLYIRYGWEFFFVIPAIVMLICSFLTLFSAYCIYLKKRQKLVSIGLNFSIIGVTLMLYLPLSFFTERFWLINSLFMNIEIYQIYLLFAIELLIIGIIATIFIFLIKKTKQRLLTTYYCN